MELEEYLRQDLPEEVRALQNNNYFLVEYNLLDLEMSHYRKMVVSSYYSFTTLSTIGLGDYHPKSDSERLVCSFMLLFGVAVFSLILKNFDEILIQLKELYEDLEDETGLYQFFALLKQFNGGKPLNENFTNQMSKFFDYKWKNDRNQALDDDEEMEIMMQLPDEVRDKIYSGFLFNDFLTKF